MGISSYSAHQKQRNFKPVTIQEMNQIYESLKTSYKYGMVLTQIPDEENVEIDCPGVFHYNQKWYMTFVSHNSHNATGGYRTHLASSEDLFHWHYEGCIFEQSKDYPQCAAFPSLQSLSFDGSFELETYAGKYWCSTMEGNVLGYEGMPMNMGRLSASDPSCPESWHHKDGLILSVKDKDVRPLETGTIYKSNIIHDKERISGHEFVAFYNAREGHNAKWVERIFMAVSDDMEHWKRLGDHYVLYKEGATITGDPQVIKIHDLWVMNLFIYPGDAPSYDTFAVSRDLIHWTLWEGAPLVCASADYDCKHAHKPWIVKKDGIVYHFYCARGKQANRGIALAVSKPLSPM